MPNTLSPQDPVIVNAIKDAQPNWLKDGLGIRGNPVPGPSGGSSGWGVGSASAVLAPQAQDPQQVDFGGSMSSPAPVDTPVIPRPPSSPVSYHPFQVIAQNFPTTSKPVNWKVGVYFGSKLFKSLQPEDDLTISNARGGYGLLEDAPDTTDPGWVATAFASNTEDKIWLEVGIDTSGTPLYGKIMCDSEGSFDLSQEAWDSDAYVVRNDQGKQVKAQILLAYITQNPDKTVTVEQVVTSHLIMQKVTLAGSQALYPAAYPSGSLEATSSHPFKCTLYPQSGGGNKVGVEYDSTLFTSLVPLTAFSGITELNDPGSPVLLDLEDAGDIVILEITFSSWVVTASDIETKGNVNTTDPSLAAWSTDNALLVDDGASPPHQTIARIVLAKWDGTTLTQNVKSHLALVDWNFDGQAAQYPVPYG